MFAHTELFVGTAVYRKATPQKWCEAVGLRREDLPGHLDAIATNLANESNPTLAAIEKSIFKIAGYVLCNLPDDCPETFGHLKVDAEYQRKSASTLRCPATNVSGQS